MVVNKRLIAFSSFYGMLIIGISLSIASPILIEISNTLGSPLFITVAVFTSFSTGYAFGPFLSRFLCRAIRRKIAIGVMFFLQTAFIFMFPLIQNIYFAFFIYFVIGLCGGFSDTAISLLITCAAAGALLAPQFIGIIYRFFNLYEGLFTIGMMLLVVALLIYCFNKMKGRKLNL